MRTFAILSVLAAVASASGLNDLQSRDVLVNQGPNGAGVILGIYAMCGAKAVDCGSGYCCLKGQTCVTSSTTKIMCSDPELSGNKDMPAIVNAAYFGAMKSGQASAVEATPSAMPSNAIVQSNNMATGSSYSNISNSINNGINGGSTTKSAGPAMQTTNGASSFAASGSALVGALAFVVAML